MQEQQTQSLAERKIEIELSLKNVAEIMNIRNCVLAQYEKNFVNKILKNKFSQLKRESERSMIIFLELNRKSYEIDLKMLRRNIFFLLKRKRGLEQELGEITEALEKEVASS